MKGKQLFIKFCIATTVVILYIACSKNASLQTSNPNLAKQSVSLYLTDSTGVFDHVDLNILSIDVLTDTTNNTLNHDNCNWDFLGTNPTLPHDSIFYTWEHLNVKSGVYDLLQYHNGVDTLLATGNIAKGSIRLLRFNLGSNNSIVKDNISYPLQISQNSNPYFLVKLNGNEWEHTATDSARLWLDINVTASISFINNSYIFSPSIRPFIPNTGTVDAVIVPPDAYSITAKLFNATDSITTTTSYFQIKGVKDGTYSLWIHSLRMDSTKQIPTFRFNDTTINNITILNANTVDLGSIILSRK